VNGTVHESLTWEFQAPIANCSQSTRMGVQKTRNHGGLIKLIKSTDGKLQGILEIVEVGFSFLVYSCRAFFAC
jgi:hypothetical protein